MSSMAHALSDDASREHGSMGLTEFTRLEKLLLFAVITECQRCIESEGRDCLDAGSNVTCPFVAIRQEYDILNIGEWKEPVP